MRMPKLFPRVYHFNIKRKLLILIRQEREILFVGTERYILPDVSAVLYTLYINVHAIIDRKSTGALRRVTRGLLRENRYPVPRDATTAHVVGQIEARRIIAIPCEAKQQRTPACDNVSRAAGRVSLGAHNGASSRWCAVVGVDSPLW